MKKTKISYKGELIKGMSNKLPSEILENPIFKKKLKEIMRSYSGIYALYKGNNLYYIGLTKNLYARIGWHKKDKHAGRWDKFIIFRIKKIRYLKDIETLIHHLVDTPGNRVKGKVPKDSDLNRVLREILMEHIKAIKRLRKVIK